MNLQGLDLSSFVDNKLEEKLIDGLEMRPGRINQILFFLHANALAGEPGLLENRQGPEDVLFDHVDHEIQMGDDDRGHAVLVSQIVIELLQVGLAIALLFDLLGVVIEIQWRRTCL